MRTYLCICRQPVFFNNSVCISCGRAIGFDPVSGQMQILDPNGDGGYRQAVAEELPKRTFLKRKHHSAPPKNYRFCANLNACGCNWLIPGDVNAETLCSACTTTRVIPDLSQPGNLERWTKLEAAKRRLLYSLLDLGLWGENSRLQNPLPLVFDLLQNMPGQVPVLTGHNQGVITLNVKEADDDVREKTRLEMREPYRSLLGHFRHESGHYYWDMLIQGTSWLAYFRTLFGDETQDYEAALQRHYTQGPPVGWEQRHISTYASSHPWEDWAETWAHWLHMQDTLESAEAAQCQSNIQQPKIDPSLLSEDGHRTTPEMKVFCEKIGRWVALTTLVNELTRSMGQPDAYPFACSSLVLRKLYFIERVMSCV